MKCYTMYKPYLHYMYIESGNVDVNSSQRLSLVIHNFFTTSANKHHDMKKC